jgi:hypothetical protein
LLNREGDDKNKVKNNIVTTSSVSNIPYDDVVAISQNLREKFFIIFDKCWGYSNESAVLISLGFDVVQSTCDEQVNYFMHFILPLFHIIADQENENLLYDHIIKNVESYRFRFAIKVPKTCTIMKEKYIEIKDYLHYDVLGDGYCAYRVLKYIKHINKNMLDKNVNKWFEYISNEELESKGKNRSLKLGSIVSSFKDDSVSNFLKDRIAAVKKNKNLSKRLYPTQFLFANADKEDVGRLAVFTDEFCIENNNSSKYETEIKGLFIDEKDQLTAVNYNQHCQVIITNDLDYFGGPSLYSLNNIYNIINSRLFAVSSKLHCTLFGYEEQVAIHLRKEVNVAVMQWCKVFSKYYKANQEDIEGLMNSIVPHQALIK